MTTFIDKKMKTIETILEEFEDNLLAESVNNEGGLLVCEINVFRKYAKNALTQQLDELKGKVEEKIREIDYLLKNTESPAWEALKTHRELEVYKLTLSDILTLIDS